jgi:hypothetical protein
MVYCTVYLHGVLRGAGTVYCTVYRVGVGLCDLSLADIGSADAHGYVALLLSSMISSQPRQPRGAANTSPWPPAVGW